MQLLPYQCPDAFDELINERGEPRPVAVELARRLDMLPKDELERRQKAAEYTLFESGITFSVYSEDTGSTERIIPFDVIPRIISGPDWDELEEGLCQRITALNRFVEDIYHEQKIIKDGVVPARFIDLGQPTWAACRGIRPPGDIWCHISGIDLVRDRDGSFCVLEDNLRCPSGVSYVLENRSVLKQTFPRVFDTLNVRSVDEYPEYLLKMLQSLRSGGGDPPRVVVMTPGIYNSAYFEHAYLAQQMGVPLVEGSDLVVHGGYVHMRTTAGLSRVDVIYRRIDDAFMDPKVFRPDSALGVPGIMEVYKKGRVALANAPGTGIADNKVIYNFVPAMIKYYLDQEPKLRNVETFLCAIDSQRQHVLDNLANLVIKPAHEAGGKGIVIGPHASKEQLAKAAEDIKADPDNWIGQPVLSLSTVPTICGGSIEARHVDLRPFILLGPEGCKVIPGGLTRVALRKGSLIVNSSQGGGTKDTWVMDEHRMPDPSYAQSQAQEQSQAVHADSDGGDA